MIAWHQVAIIVPNAFPCRNSPIKFALNTKYVGLNSRFTAKSFWCYPFFRIQGSLDLESSLKKFQAIQIEHAKCHAKMLICPIGTYIYSSAISNTISHPLVLFILLKLFSHFRRFYVVSSQDGHLPPGTPCHSKDPRSSQAYCVMGKCLNFGKDMTLSELSEETLSDIKEIVIKPRSLRYVRTFTEKELIATTGQRGKIYYMIIFRAVIYLL